jgi:hypothetical protein
MGDRQFNVTLMQVAIHRLTANLLRIAADGGRVVDLARELDEANKLVKEVGAQMGWPRTYDAMHEGLQISWPRIENATDDEREFNEDQHSTSLIVQYALRLAAAKIETNSSLASKNQSLLYSSVKAANR